MRAVGAALVAVAASVLAPAASAAGWSEALAREIDRIDQATDGRLGVYVKDLATGETLDHGAREFWYLGSTAKVPVAIAVLQDVDAKRIALGERIAVQPSDRIEASQVVWQPVGTRYPVDDLLRRMLFDSDNTAANMLIRRVGLDRLNASARAAMGREGFGGFTDFAQVRYDVYAEIHPDARRLTNDQLVRIAAAPLGPGRVENVRRALDKRPDELRVRTLDEAYAAYYRTLKNSATLVAYGDMLEKLVRGQLLSPDSTATLFEYTKLGNFTNYRLQAGLPRALPFIHKTGTQYLRACHAGVIRPEQGAPQGVVVVACTADVDEQKTAGEILRQVGVAIARTPLATSRP